MSQRYSSKVVGCITCGITSLAVVTAGLSKADAASMTFSVTGANSTSQNALAATAVFDDSLINSGKLTVTLTNTKGVSVPSDILTSVFWDYAGSPLNLSLTSATGSKVTDYVTTTTGNGKNATTTTTLNTTSNVDLLGSLNEWKFASSKSSSLSGISEHYGLGTAGLGIFQGGGGQQFNYGIIGGYNANANDPVKQAPLVNNSVTFTLSGLSSSFDITKINNVRFQYGTSLSEASITQATGKYYTPTPKPKTVPEPGTTAALVLFALGALRVVKKKSLITA